MTDAQHQLRETIEALKATERILETLLKGLNEPQPATFGLAPFESSEAPHRSIEAR
jgi:hypothetical protein